MKFFEMILLALTIFQAINCEEKRYFYRCGVDGINVKPIPAMNFVTVKKDKRSLGEKKFKDFKIYLDLINIKNDIVKFHLEEYESLFISALKKAVETLEALLKVEDTGRGFKFTDSDIERIEIPDWNKTMIGTNAIGNSQELGIDLFILGRFDNEMDPHTLATAGPSYSDGSSHRPIVGVVNINSNVNYSLIHSKEYFQSIIIHEFTHILGFLQGYFTNYYHNIFNRTDEYGLVRYYINSSKVLEVAKKYFNCQDIDGVELEESGGSGTAGSHWDARILLGEYMNGVIYTEEQVISEFTLALLEDTGFYKPNYYTGGLMRFGKGKGCDFIKNRCVDSNHKINPFFENEFYDSIVSPSMDASCSSGRQSRAYHAWWLYSNLPSYYQYFSDPRYGGFSPADYCPVSMSYHEENENTYYTGQCNFKGNGQYGMRIYYPETKTTNNGTHTINRTEYNYYTSEILKEITGETYSDHSFCYQSSLIKEGNTFNSDVVRAICYESFCSDRSLTVKINNDYVVCPRSGGKIEVEGYKGFFLCPDYNLICSGTVMCNDMFDCVDKKSEAKNESYIYDYTIKTSQNIEDAEISDFENSTNYELSDNGICPKDCEHCYTNNTCLKCRIDYNLIGSKNNQEIKCISNSKVNKGYYKENNIYYPCMSKCDVCSNDLSCQTCSEGYDYINSKCKKHITPITNCEEYDEEDGSCSKCNENYAFKGENRTYCENKNNLENYYSKDEGKSYYPCENELSGCSKCYYDVYKNLVKCYLCKIEYALYAKDNLCIPKHNINKLFYYFNETHINNCSNDIPNCEECESGEVCTKCKNNFYMVNDFKKICIGISYINTSQFYLDNNQNMFYSCSNGTFHDVLNCKECKSKSNCTLCQDDYTFIDGNKFNCVKKSDLNNKYIPDPLDKTNFIKCERKYYNCDTCNTNQCISCKDGFTFINGNKSNCVEIRNLANKYVLDPLDESNYIKCENKYSICDTCNITHCLTCKNGFTFINGNKLNCFKRSDLNNTYVQDPLDESNYIKCENKYSNCNICNITHCLSCKNGFTFINWNKLNCVKKSDLNNTYIQDPLDSSIYIKCENKYNNCDTCNNNICLTCKEGFTFINGNKLNCVKKSDLNNTYIQDLSDLSNFIKCENRYSNCDTCNDSLCLSCKNGFSFIDGNKSSCVKMSDLNNTYIQDPSDQFNLIKCENKYNNCYTCNNNICLSCKSGFSFINGNKLNCVNKNDLNTTYIQDPLDPFNFIKCENKYNNCDTCNNNLCLTCKDGFTFINGNKLNCVKKSDLNNIYIQDPSDQSNFIKCENRYSNCDTCNITHCLTCKNDYIFINRNKSSCFKMSDLYNKYIQDPLDPSIFIKCEYIYTNCDTCNNIHCLSCKSGFTFINGNKLNCVKKSDLDNTYIQDPSENTNYIKCENKYTNCNTCNNNQCLSCKNDFTFINGNKLNCIKRSELNNTYIQDPSDQYNYIKCEKKYKNCETCNNNQCSSCKNDFIFINGNKLNCVKKSDLNNTYIQDPLDPSNYIKCENKYNNCYICNTTQCLFCKTNYIFINGDKTTCLKKTDLNNKYIQDPSDKSNYFKCENKYSNCDSCTNRQCFSCKSGYIFINDDYTNCLLKSNIDLKFYYSKDNNMYYSCKLIKYRNNKECKKLLNEANSEEQEKTLVKQLYILQVQIINKLLKIFLTLTVNIEKGLHIKFSINLFKNRLRQRNLQGSSKSQEVNLYLDNVSGNIATLTSKEEFEETDRIVVNKEQGDEYELYLLNNDNKVLDTLENKKKIDNNKVVDFSEINSDYPVKKYYIESSSSGCSFNLVSKDSIRESNKEINLTFIQKDDINNNINAKCTLSSDNEKNIPCSLGEEFEEKNYNLQSYVGSNTNSLFYIFQDNDGYQLSCSDEKKDKDKKIIIIAIAAGGAALLGIIITIICCCCKKKKVEKVHFPEKNFTIKETEENSFNNNNFDKKNKKNKKKKKKKKKKKRNNNNNNKKMSTYRDINNKRTNKKSK